MPKVSDAHRAARRTQILGAAVRCFARKGYRGTSMTDIIAESGLSAGAIYGHFEGKQELFAAVAEQVLAAREGDLEARHPDGTPLTPGELMRTLLDGFRREPFSHVVVQLWSEAAIDPEIRRLANAVFVRLRATVTAQLVDWANAGPGRVTGDPEAWARRVAPVVLAVAPGFMVQRAIVEDFDDEGYLAALAETLPH
ncbi:TetR/AcrR family transcriptional regulator [Agromyces aerolatus]|uniref:TetR/AcrR family transcriptional regulator n=1 Tax=Agromyces sp. LY-1074 TaxID=3074080 RepID=UPI00285FDAE9|nr:MULTISPECIES: TetR/AcrR family transcriptional regulator [unclassified Agromyces]MDR5698281.1 TetR/AcrR family transcriptional regulator [Agromyces sp. LY-1074]MDR5704575.1 TetR/AcrR family transcriptional regulator [Agromyces sp. LY-1358]